MLESLALQDYPGAEIILVDDRSTDRTAELLAAFVRDHAQARVLTLKENPGPNRKQYALSRALEAARGELFLFTDADCRFSPRWIRAMVERMADSRTGAVIGAVFRQPGPRGFLYSYQCYDHVVRMVYLAGAVGLGAAGGGFGNNLIIRRSALEAAGGYAAVPPSPTEDAALISLTRASTAYRVGSACGREAHVFTGCENSWKALINQTLRWNNGGLFSPEIVTRINYTVLMVTISACTLALFLLPLFPKLWPLPLAQLIVMLENTAGALFIARGGLAAAGQEIPTAGAKAGFREKASLPPALWIRELLFMPFYMTLMTVMGFLGIRTSWKESDVKPYGGK
ncbi:MAG: glycosyltransferase [Treponema sp.]|nr:glycosyltransferase [Treponema sp.]